MNFSEYDWKNSLVQIFGPSNTPSTWRLQITSLKLKEKSRNKIILVILYIISFFPVEREIDEWALFLQYYHQSKTSKETLSLSLAKIECIRVLVIKGNYGSWSFLLPCTFSIEFYFMIFWCIYLACKCVVMGMRLNACESQKTIYWRQFSDCTRYWRQFSDCTRQVLEDWTDVAEHGMRAFIHWTIWLIPQNFLKFSIISKWSCLARDILKGHSLQHGHSVWEKNRSAVTLACGGHLSPLACSPLGSTGYSLLHQTPSFASEVITHGVH